MTVSKKGTITVLAILVFGFAAGVRAHEGYITTYSHHITQGEFEVMLMNDFTSPSEPKKEEDGRGEYFSQMIELEYAPTDRLAFEFMIEAFEDIKTGEKQITGFRYEARYRLFEDGTPLNPSLYLEFEDLHVDTRYKMEVSGWVLPPYEEGGEEPFREKILESRLLLSQDIGAFNVAFNWINESDLGSGVTAFGYSLGFLFRLGQGAGQHAHHGENPGFFTPASLAFELFGALGDTKAFGIRQERQEHYFQPSITVHVGENLMFSAGFAVGLTQASDDLIRLNWGLMF